MVIHYTLRLEQAGNREIETHHGAMPPSVSRIISVARRENIAVHDIAAFRVGDARWLIMALSRARPFVEPGPMLPEART